MWWMFLTCLWRLDEMEKERSQKLHLYGCSPVCVRRCRVRLADRGNVLPQYLQPYRSFCLTPLEAVPFDVPEVVDDDVGERICLSVLFVLLAALLLMTGLVVMVMEGDDGLAFLDAAAAAAAAARL